MEVFGSSGVRGIALEEFTPADALLVAQAAGQVFRERFDATRVAVGRDTRLTGELMASAVASGLASTGCAVDRVGTVPTPALQAYCEREAVPGVMVTASHNPPQFTGIKLCGSDGIELTRDDIETVEAVLRNGPSLATWENSGRIRQVAGVNRQYREDVSRAVDRERIADADLTVALDPGHGSATSTSPELFSELGCTVTTVNAQPDGRFPGRNPEPVEENLTELRRLVRTTDADLGIAHDGDGDRAVFFDETGSFIDGDAVLAALATVDLSPGETVVSAVNASQRLVDVVDQIGANLELTPIGSTNIITTIQQLREAGETVPLAGEGNGGIIVPEYRMARDGAYTAARFCELLSEQPASEVVADYDGYVKVRRDLSYENETERARMLEAIATKAADSDATLDTTDGHRLDYGDAWVLARPSGTEPVVRVYAEAREHERANALADELVEAIQTKSRQ